MTGRDDFEHRLGQGLKRWAQAGRPTMDLEACVRERMKGGGGPEPSEPPAADEVNRGRRRRWLPWLGGAAAASTVALVLSWTFPRWAGAAADLPLVGPVITRFILAGAGLQWAYDMGLIGEPVAEVTQNGITVRILGVVADARRTTVLYQVLGAPSTVGRGRQPRVPVHATITAQMSEFTPPEETPLGYLGTVSTLPLEAEAAELEVRFDVGAETITLTVPASRTETDRFSREVAVNRALEYDGVRITVEAVIYTPAETIVRYREEVTESFDFPVQWDGDVHCNYLEAGGQRYRQSGSGGGLNSVSYLAFPPVRGPARLVLKPAVKAEPLDAVWPLEEGAVAEVVGVPVTLAGIERRPGAIELSWTSPVREGFVGVSGFEVIDGEGNVYPLGGSWAGFSNYTHDGVRYQRYETELPEGLEPVAVRATKAGVLVDGPWVFDLPG